MKYLIVGSGIAGVTFAEELRKNDASCEIIILTEERNFYYFRPNLTHGFCSNNQDSFVAKTFEQLRNNDIQVFEGVHVFKIDHPSKNLHFRAGEAEVVLAYDNLILANGSVAFVPPNYLPYRDNFFTFHSLEDLLHIKQMSAKIIEEKGHCHFGIIGGGAIGCELASELKHCGNDVSIFHLNSRLLDRLLSVDESERLQNLFQKQGIEVYLSEQVQSIRNENGVKKIINNKNETIGEFDLVGLAIGFSGNTQLAKDSEIPCNRGIKVNGYLQTEIPYIYAIGDIAEVEGKGHLFTYPIWDQATYLAKSICHGFETPWSAPTFEVKLKIHDF